MRAQRGCKGVVYMGLSVYRFIGVWQQESSQRPQRENGATVRASGVIPHTPSLGVDWAIGQMFEMVAVMLGLRWGRPHLPVRKARRVGEHHK